MQINVNFEPAKARAKRFSNALLDKAEENPVAALIASGIVLKGGASLMRANTERKNAKTWNREVARRERNARSNTRK